MPPTPEELERYELWKQMIAAKGEEEFDLSEEELEPSSFLSVD